MTGWRCSSCLNTIYWYLALISVLHYLLLNAIHWQLAQLLRGLTGLFLTVGKWRPATHKAGTDNQKTCRLLDTLGVVLIRCTLFGFSVISTNKRKVNGGNSVKILCSCLINKINCNKIWLQVAFYICIPNCEWFDVAIMEIWKKESGCVKKRLWGNFMNVWQWNQNIINLALMPENGLTLLDIINREANQPSPELQLSRSTTLGGFSFKEILSRAMQLQTNWAGVKTRPAWHKY